VQPVLQCARQLVSINELHTRREHVTVNVFERSVLNMDSCLYYVVAQRSYFAGIALRGYSEGINHNFIDLKSKSQITF